MVNFNSEREDGCDIISLKAANFRMSVKKDRILAAEESGPLYWVTLYSAPANFDHIAATYVFEVLNSNAPERTEIPLFREAIAFYMYTFRNSGNYLMSIPEFSDFYPGEAHWEEEAGTDFLPDPFHEEEPF